MGSGLDLGGVVALHAAVMQRLEPVAGRGGTSR